MSGFETLILTTSAHDRGVTPGGLLRVLHAAAGVRSAEVGLVAEGEQVGSFDIELSRNAARALRTPLALPHDNGTWWLRRDSDLPDEGQVVLRLKNAPSSPGALAETLHQRSDAALAGEHLGLVMPDGSSLFATVPARAARLDAFSGTDVDLA